MTSDLSGQGKNLGISHRWQMNKCFTIPLKSTSLNIISEEFDLFFELKNLQSPVNQGKGQGEIAETNSNNFILSYLLIRHLNSAQHGKRR